MLVIQEFIKYLKSNHFISIIFFIYSVSNVNDKLMVSSSAEEISPEDIIGNQSSPVLRNRYLNRIGVEHAAGSSDCEPLLN